MLGKPEWFKRRKYTGWGLTPQTWQGWAYLVLLIAPLIVLRIISVWNADIALILGCVLALVLGLDVLDIMTQLKQDEREILHEALAERNATWAIVTVLAIGMAFQISSNLAAKKGVVFDPVILAALLAGMIAKAYTNWKLEKIN